MYLYLVSLITTLSNENRVVQIIDRWFINRQLHGASGLNAPRRFKNVIDFIVRRNKCEDHSRHWRGMTHDGDQQTKYTRVLKRIEIGMFNHHKISVIDAVQIALSWTQSEVLLWRLFKRGKRDILRAPERFLVNTRVVIGFHYSDEMQNCRKRLPSQ